MAVPDGVLALIPARGGSKGIPGKNLQVVDGVPLICRSIRAAKSSRRVGRVLVTTDDEAIATASEREGASVIRRPDEIAGDTASSESALLHALQYAVNFLRTCAMFPPSTMVALLLGSATMCIDSIVELELNPKTSQIIMF